MLISSDFLFEIFSSLIKLIAHSLLLNIIYTKWRTIVVKVSKMESFNIDYSKKNSSISTEKEYKIQLIAKVESFTKRMSWKALEFLGKLDSSEKETFVLKSHKCPPSVDVLAGFESDLLMMVQNIKFRLGRNDFLSKLKEDVKVINNTKEL